MKRATKYGKDVESADWNFNPRPREEGDAVPAVFIAKFNDFNPRPREEGDDILY